MEKNFHLISALLLFLGITIAFIIGVSFSMNDEEDLAGDGGGQAAEAPAQTQEFEHNPPSLDDVPDGPLGESIKYGYDIMMNTNTVLDGYVGNELSCASCHGNAGMDQTSSFVGVINQFPEYRPREAKVYTIQDRINGCMLRSMNGKPIPHDSEEMRAMVAYLSYISKGIPSGVDLPWRKNNRMEKVPEPNVANGEKLYKQSCVACHAADGSGTGPNSGPALWGEKSFNEGAGMARISTMAGYIKRNMPPGQGGSLSDQDAADLAAWILSHERPEWKGRANDWPKGGAPKDVPYYDELNSVKQGLK